MESEDTSLYESFRFRVLEEMIEETKQKSGYFIMVVDKKSLGIISGAVTVLDLTERGVTVIEQLEKTRKPMPQVDALYFLTASHKSITKATADFIEQAAYRQVHLFFTGKVSDKLMRVIANSSMMPYIKTFKEVNCGFRIIGRDCFSLEHSGLLSSLYTPKTPEARKEIIAYISTSLVSVCGVMRELPYICYQANSQLAQELSISLEENITDMYRKLPDVLIKPNRPIMMIIDRNYDMVTPLAHDVHYEALLKDLFEVGPEGKVKYESTDNTGCTTAKEAVINEKDSVWVKLRYEEVDEAQAHLGRELRAFRAENQVIESAGDADQDLKTMAKVVSGLSNYNETVSKFAVHRYLLDACMKSFGDEGITELSEIEQMLLTGFDNEKKEYKESDLIKKILKKLQTLENPKEKLRLAMVTIAGMELSANDRILITNQLPARMALSISKLGAFGLSLQNENKSRKRLNKLYINSLQARIPNITKIYNYAILKLSDLVFAANSNSLDGEGFVFGRSVPPNVEDMQPQVKSLRKKQGAAIKSKRKIILFIVGGVSYSELRVIQDFPDIHLVVGGTKIVSPMEFVEEIVNMEKQENEDIDPRDIELDFR